MVFVNLFIAEKNVERTQKQYDAENLLKFIVVVIITILTVFCLICMIVVTCRCLNKWIRAKTRCVYVEKNEQ